MNKLTDFISKNNLKNFSVLVIENEEISAEIKTILPCAQIKFLAECELPEEPEIFDIVIAKNIFTYEQNFYRKLLEINHNLKDSGYLLTEFLNVRCAEILERIKIGKFSVTEQRYFAKWDIVKILDDAIYKEIRFLSGEKISDKNFADSWIKIGFENFNEDLLTKNWLIKAQKCSSEVLALKEIYTKKIRAELSRLLHRIEYEIEIEKNLDALKKLCEREKIFYEYLSDFTDQVVIHENAKNFIKTEMKNLKFD